MSHSSTSTSGLTQEEARAQLERCGFCLCLDVPAKVEFGIDLRSWLVGERFAGLKLIPAGLHYISWR